MLRLPLPNSPIRDLFCIEHLAEMASPSNRDSIPLLRDAVRNARKYLAGEAMAVSLNTICLGMDGTLQLVQVSRDSTEKLWIFGPL